MVVPPIPTHLVDTVFQYIFPPSLPLPSHLLSRPLIERHHFLGISSTDAVSYLTWPSPHVAQVAEALEFAEGPLSQPPYDVRYSAPDEHTLLAHIHPHTASPLRIVFSWDVETESWRYHDARVMPFPEGSLSSLDAALAQRPRNSLSDLSPNETTELSREAGSLSPDNYWTGYGSSSSSPITPAPVNVNTEEDEKAEASYWASYDTVHGSTESALPSPRNGKGHLLPGDNQHDLRGPDVPTDPLITHLHLRLHEHSELMSPRFYPHADNPDPPYVSSKITSESVEYPAKEALLHGQRSDRWEVEEGVKDVVRGVYRMWKARTSSADVETFVGIVKSALETL